MTIEQLLQDGWYQQIPTTAPRVNLHTIRKSRQKRDEWLEEMANETSADIENDVTGKN